MTVEEADMAIFSPFEVTEDGPLTSAKFTRLQALATAKLTRDDPGLSEAEYDQACVLLIAHMHVASQGNLEKTTEKIENYWVQKEAGKTSFIIQYDQLIADASQAAWPTEGDTHSDVSSMGEMQLDQEEVPALYDLDEITEADE
jgi:hypothetical protein